MDDEPATKRKRTQRNNSTITANNVTEDYFEGVPVGAFVVRVQHLNSLLRVLRSVEMLDNSMNFFLSLCIFSQCILGNTNG